jgi:hypothetical protein
MKLKQGPAGVAFVRLGSVLPGQYPVLRLTGRFLSGNKTSSRDNNNTDVSGPGHPGHKEKVHGFVLQDA